MVVLTWAEVGPQIKKVEDQTHLSGVARVDKRDDITRARWLVNLVLRKGDRTIGVVLLSNEDSRALKNVGIYVVDAKYVSAWGLECWK